MTYFKTISETKNYNLSKDQDPPAEHPTQPPWSTGFLFVFQQLNIKHWETSQFLLQSLNLKCLKCLKRESTAYFNDLYELINLKNIYEIVSI